MLYDGDGLCSTVGDGNWRLRFVVCGVSWVRCWEMGFLLNMYVRICLGLVWKMYRLIARLFTRVGVGRGLS